MSVCLLAATITSPFPSHFLPPQNSGPRNSFYCLGHFKNVYDDGAELYALQERMSRSRCRWGLDSGEHRIKWGPYSPTKIRHFWKSRPGLPAVDYSQWLNYSARGGGSLQARGLKGRSSSLKGREQRWGSQPPTRGCRAFKAL